MLQECLHNVQFAGIRRFHQGGRPVAGVRVHRHSERQEFVDQTRHAETGSIGQGCSAIGVPCLRIGSRRQKLQRLGFILVPNGQENIRTPTRVTKDADVTRLTGTVPMIGTVRSGLCVDSANDLYCSDTVGNRIYRYRSNGTVELFVGSGNQGAIDGNGVFTSFNGPTALACDSADNLYVWDSGNYIIRRINQARDVTTITKSGGGQNMDGIQGNISFNWVYSMAVDGNGNLIVAGYSCIRKLSADLRATTIPGSSWGILGWVVG